jgi:hypothetical protein
MSGTDGPHPTKTTAAIVVSRRCFILILHTPLAAVFAEEVGE